VAWEGQYLTIHFLCKRNKNKERVIRKRIVRIIVALILIITTIVLVTQPASQNDGNLKENQDLVLLQQASEEKNISQCNGIENLFMKDSCYKIVSISNLESSGCIKIESQQMKKDCYCDIVKETKDETICETMDLDISFKDKCYWNVASLKQDRSLCENIVDETLKEACSNGRTPPNS